MLAQLLLGSIFLLSCNKYDLPKDVPTCIQRKIKSFLKKDKRNPPAKIWQYTYNGETVYYIPSYCCDIPSDLLNEKCKIICHPDGGDSGNGSGTCSDFFRNRINEKLIWEDKR